jgi:receptor expression-enhancing protein 5/6
MSFIALESEGEDDDKQWLTYWVCYGAFNIVDQFAGIILQFIPFYYFLKTGFLIFLFHPSTLGATMVYNTYVLPLMKEHEGKIMEYERMAQEKFNEGHKLVTEKMDGGKKDE